MKFKHAVRVRRAVVALAATVALSAVASPAEQVRGRFQLRLGEAHKLLTASARAR
jgi:hypothetical protein